MSPSDSSRVTDSVRSLKLVRQSAGQYATRDGRYRIEWDEWWLEGECECLMCRQHSPCLNGGMARRSGWTVWDVAADDHLSGEPFEFETLREARSYLAARLASSPEGDR